MTCIYAKEAIRKFRIAVVAKNDLRGGSRLCEACTMNDAQLIPVSAVHVEKILLGSSHPSQCMLRKAWIQAALRALAVTKSSEESASLKALLH